MVESRHGRGAEARSVAAGRGSSSRCAGSSGRCCSPRSSRRWRGPPLLREAARAGRLPAGLAAVPVVLLAAFIVGYAVYRFTLVRAGRYPAGKAMVQLALMSLFLALMVRWTVGARGGGAGAPCRSGARARGRRPGPPGAGRGGPAGATARGGAAPRRPAGGAPGGSFARGPRAGARVAGRDRRAGSTASAPTRRRPGAPPSRGPAEPRPGARVAAPRQS